LQFGLKNIFRVEIDTGPAISGDRMALQQQPEPIGSLIAARQRTFHESTLSSSLMPG
jgi:hypothetical protein